MRLLLVGFSEQNVKTLNMFCQRGFKAFSCVPVEQKFTKDMRLFLPTLTEDQTACDAYMIFLEGVGMTVFKPEYIKPLKQFIGTKPCLLVTRKKSDRWGGNPELISPRILFLDAPYNTQSIKHKFDKLLNILVTDNRANRLDNPDVGAARLDGANDGDTVTDSANNTPSTTNEGYRQNNNPYTKASEADVGVDVEKSAYQALYESVTDNPKTKLMDDALRTYYPDLYKQSLIRNTLLIWAQTAPLKITVGAHEFYVNSLERCAVAREDIGRLIDFVSIAGRYLYADTMSIDITPVSSTAYQAITKQLLKNGYRNYSLYTFMWQLMDTALQQEFDYNEHHLKIKVINLPNFSVMDNVPDYTYPVLAACLSKPRSIEQLHGLFPSVNMMTLNRVLIVAMMAGILDATYLFSDIDSSNALQGQSSSNAIEGEIEVSKAVQSARQSGFFKRLLRKLSF